MDTVRNLADNWQDIPKAVLRLCFILVNNAYCIPTYVVWMVLLLPLKKVNPDVYWKIEGYFFHWLLAMVSMWSWSAGYEIEEVGDDISKCLEERTLVIANHQSTGDVPMLMATFNAKKQVLPNLMWIMDNVFKYTNFGIVSVIHQDFFIMSGKKNRDQSLHALVNHLLTSFVPRKRKWMVLFPEGGFLRKRKAVSQSYALKNDLPILNYVSLPRVGALQAIMSTLGPHSEAKNNNPTNSPEDLTETSKICWVLDITIAYPNGDPIGLPEIIFGNRPPCKTTLMYRLFRSRDLPRDPEALTTWLYDRWQEKEGFLEVFYKTGRFPVEGNCTNPVGPQVVTQDYLRFVILHLFFITSTFVHLQMLYAVYSYCVCWAY